jgi:hypothetical protein
VAVLGRSACLVSVMTGSGMQTSRTCAVPLTLWRHSPLSASTVFLTPAPHPTAAKFAKQGHSWQPRSAI